MHNVSNLEIVTPAENTRHAFRHGRIDHAGEKNAAAKLDWDKVKAIRFLATQFPNRWIARVFAVKPNTVSQIVTGARWRDRQALPDVRELH